jgi:replicative DNA helicase
MLASKIELSEPDAELTLLGSLFVSPTAMGQIAPVLRAEWFSDPLARYLYDAALRVHLSGSHLSTQSIIASLPEQCGTMTRGQLYARACASAVPQSSLGGVVDILKDRWQRRTILAAAEAMTAAVGQIECDPVSVAAETLGALDSVVSSKATSRMVSMAEAVGKLTARMQNPNGTRGATTGYMSLDGKLNGYAPGQLYVIGGRPGMGKSAFACSSLLRTAQSGRGVGMFALEMSSEEVSARMASDVLDNVRAPAYGDILKANLSKDQADEVAFAMSCLQDVPLYIEDAGKLTMQQIAVKARELKARYDAEGTPLAVICIDHLSLVSAGDRYAGNKVAETAEVSNACRILAKELNCCVVLLCQLSRDNEKREDKRPTLSDLRWSGDIEQDAHVVAFVFREVYYLSQDPNVMPHVISDAKNKFEFLIRKNRNGETGDVSMWCSIQHSAVRDE